MPEKPHHSKFNASKHSLAALNTGQFPDGTVARWSLRVQVPTTAPNGIKVPQGMPFPTCAIAAHCGQGPAVSRPAPLRLSCAQRPLGSCKVEILNHPRGDFKAAHPRATLGLPVGTDGRWSSTSRVLRQSPNGTRGLRRLQGEEALLSSALPGHGATCAGSCAR